MFKDLYKQANDKIDTEAVRSRVTARLERESSPIHAGSRHIGRYAALAACFILTLAAASVYESFQKKNKNDILYPADAAVVSKSEAVPEKSADYGEETENTYTAGSEVDKKTQKSAAPASSPKAEPKIEPKAELPESKATINEDIPAPHAAAEADLSAHIEAEDAAQPDIALQSSEIAVAAAGGGSSRMAAASRSEHIDSYYSSVAENITADAVLPDGFEHSSAVPFTADAQENQSVGKQSFLFEKGDAYINITITKNTEEIQSEMNAVGDRVFNEDSSFTAYLISNGIGYEITGIGISENELDALLVSLG